MHGSLLPRYRGRAPLNWAILNGETQTGVTLALHDDTRADAGDIVDQLAVPILVDDLAIDVMNKVTRGRRNSAGSFATLVSCRAWRHRLAYNASLPGSTHGRRAPEDGRID